MAVDTQLAVKGNARSACEGGFSFLSATESRHIRVQRRRPMPDHQTILQLLCRFGMHAAGSMSNPQASGLWAPSEAKAARSRRRSSRVSSAGMMLAPLSTDGSTHTPAATRGSCAWRVEESDHAAIATALGWCHLTTWQAPHYKRTSDTSIRGVDIR